MKYKEGLINRIPLLGYSAEEMESTYDAEVQFHSLKRIWISGIEWINIIHSYISRTEITVFSSNEGLSEYVEYGDITGSCYFTLLDGQLYKAEFISPHEKYPSLEALFKLTMENCINLNP